MRKSPGRWLKTLFGKKSSRSSSTKSKNSSEKGLSQGYEAPLGDNSPIISEPVLVSTYSNTNLPIVEETHFSDMHGCETTLPVVSQSALDQVPIQNQSRGCNKLCEEKAATKAQAAIRGFLARREFRALKGVVRLQALVRGHLVRRQAVATLYAMYAIVRLQVIVRGRIARHSNISLPVNYAKSQHDVLMSCTSGDAWKKNFQDNSLGHQLLYSRVVFKPLLVQFKKEDPNSVSSWLERWHLTHFWKPVVKADHSKPQQRKSKKVSANQTLKTNPKLTKHQASKSEPEKRKDNLHRQTTQVPKTEIEKPKQVLKKVANSRSDAETGKLSSGSKKSHSKAVREISKDSETTSETVNANSSEVRLSLSGDEESKKVIHKRSSLSTPVEVAEKESNVEATTSEGKSLSDNREAGSRSNSRRSSLSTTRPEIPEKELHSTLSSSAAKTLLDRNASEEKSLSSTKDSGTKLNNKRRSSLSDASKTMPDGKLSEEKPLSSSGNSVNKLNSRRRSSLSAAASKTIPDAKPSEEKPLSSSGDSSDNSGNKLNSRRRSSISDVSKTMPDGKPSEGKPLSSSGDSADKSNNRRRSSLSTTRLEISENELNVSVNKSASKILTDVNSSEEKSLSSNGEPTNRSNNRRRSSFSAGVEIPETELHSSTLKSVPSYMATTESAKARLRGQSSPRVVTTPDTADKNGPVRRHSLPSGSANGKLKSISPRTQKPLNSGGSKGLIKGDRSLNLSRDGSEKSVHTEWRRW